MPDYSASPLWDETIEWFMENPFEYKDLIKNFNKKYPGLCVNMYACNGVRRMYDEYYTRYYALLSIFQGVPDDSSIEAKGEASKFAEDDYHDDWDDEEDYVEDEEY